MKRQGHDMCTLQTFGIEADIGDIEAQWVFSLQWAKKSS